MPRRSLHRDRCDEVGTPVATNRGQGSAIDAFPQNWLTRTLVNDGGGIWANPMEEVIYYKAFVDSAGNRISGDDAYTLHFPKDQLPAQYATYFWSVIAVDARHRRVLPNPPKRYLLNRKPSRNTVRTLMLYFADARPKNACFSSA